MLSSREFISANEKLINQEVDAILEAIAEQLSDGYFAVKWVLRYSPTGAAQYIASEVNRKMETKGWRLDSEVNYSKRLLNLKVYPNVGALNGVYSISIK